MGIENISDKRVQEMAKTLVKNYFVLEGQRLENKEKIQYKAPYWTTEDLIFFQELDKGYDITLQRIRNRSLLHLESIPLWKEGFLSHVEEIPPVYALALMSSIGDISQFKYPSKLWSYCGMHNYKVDIVSGKRWFNDRQKAVEHVTSVLRTDNFFRELEGTSIFKTELNERVNEFCVYGMDYRHEMIAAKRNPKKMVNWNTSLRSLCWRIGESINKNQGFYHDLLVKMEEEEASKLRRVSDVDLRIINLQSRRHITKLYLIHIVQYGRQLKGLFSVIPPEGKIIEYPGFPIVYSEYFRRID